MKINFKKNLTDLSGEEVKSNDQTVSLGKLLADSLATSSDDDPVKYIDWALRIHKGEEVDLDRSDQDKLKKFIKENKRFNNLIKAQLLDCFDEKTEKKK